MSTPSRNSRMPPVLMVEIECANEEGCDAIVGYVSSRWLPADDQFGMTFPEILCPECGEARS